MAKGDKYIALTSYFENCEQDVIHMSFQKIESILGERLTDAAYKYQAFWSNSESQPISNSWRSCGYMSRNLNLTSKTIEFVKVGSVKSVSDLKVKTNKEKAVVERKSTLSVEEAIRYIRTYYNDTVKDEHGRYLSWCHCYNAFKENRNNKDTKNIDYLALHLAFYLASWGMYRGSAFLLQKDYKVHTPIVEIILEDKYTPLLGVTAEELLDDAMLDLLDEVSTRIRKTFAEEKSSFEGGVNNTTDTLVTKILLGTLGCVPAYDRYYIQAVKQYNVSAGVFNRRSVKDISKYYLKYKDEFEKLRMELNSSGTEYPVMKLMDMCMWQVAFENGN